MPTLFNPQAYLPPYILQPGQQAQGMMWAQQQPQQVPYNPYGPQTGVPLGAGGAAGPLPAYFPGAAGENPFGDEKRVQEYEEVKV